VVVNHDQIAVEDFKPKFLAKSTMARKAADGAMGQAKRELIWMAAKHDRDLRLVAPKYTTMDCGQCSTRANHCLPLSQRTYTCSACGRVKPLDGNFAAVMVARAGFNPAGVYRARLASPTGKTKQRESGSPCIYPWGCDMKSPVITVRKEELVIQLTKPTGTCGRSNRPV
jgi:putative transposase